MTTKRDYYETLGVGRTASEEDIRKAFRKKALEFHPDRNKQADAANRFKEVNEAYQVLTDPDRRQRYDQFGHAGVNNDSGPGPAGFDGFDIFGGVGDIFDAFFGGNQRSRSRASAGRNLQTNLTVSFEEAVFGTTRDIQIGRVERCPRCDGKRSEPGHQPRNCSVCRGSGRVRRHQRSVFGNFMTEVVCNQCAGSGQEISHPCKQCNGSGRDQNKRTIQVQVPAGVPDGANLSLRGQGDAGDLGTPPGDLYVSIHIKQHSIFERHDNDILHTIDISFPQASLGAELSVPTLEGQHSLKIPSGTQSGEVFRVKGKGVPHLGRQTRRGDHLITVKVVTPQRLSQQQKELLEQLHRSFSANQ